MPANNIVEVLEALESLARTGWMLRGVPSQLAENVAQHSFKASLLAFEIAVRLRMKGFEINPEKAAVIALLHDVGESVIGDIPKTAGIPEAKKAAEHHAIRSLPLSEEAKQLIMEYESGSSKEAIVARVAEMLATLIEAERYASLGYRVEEIKESMEKSLQKIYSMIDWGREIESIVSELTGSSSRV